VGFLHLQPILKISHLTKKGSPDEKISSPCMKMGMGHWALGIGQNEQENLSSLASSPQSLAPIFKTLEKPYARMMGTLQSRNCGYG
jgi:hypothetical protein